MPEEEKAAQGPQELDPSKTLTLHIVYIKGEGDEERVEVRGQINRLGDCYKALEMTKDVIREHNRLNSGYLNFKRVEPDAPKKKGLFGNGRN